MLHCVAYVLLMCCFALCSVRLGSVLMFCLCYAVLHCVMLRCAVLYCIVSCSVLIKMMGAFNQDTFVI